MSLENLLGEAKFSPGNRQKWLALAEKALGGATFDEALVSRTDDGIPIQPIDERWSSAQAQPRRRPDAPWAVVQRIDDPDPARANLQAARGARWRRDRPGTRLRGGAECLRLRPAGKRRGAGGGA